MKVAILTLRLHANYGGILQAYAMMTVLRRLGHEPWLIFNQPFKDRRWYSSCALFMANAFRKFVLGERQLEVFRERRIRREFETVYTNTLRFVDEHVQPRTGIVCSQGEWKRLKKDYGFDAFVVGSDQVWRPLYAKPIERYFLSFLGRDKTEKRIAYAASFGVDEWTFTPRQTARCMGLLRLFDAVSVREKSGVQLCADHLAVDAAHVLDPTMLLEAKDYIALLKPEAEERRRGVLVYVLDRSAWKDALVKDMEAALSLPSFRVNNVRSEDCREKTACRIAPPVESWLAGFASAQFVVTDSFHASVFAILFHVPFVVCANRGRGMARIRSLLEMFGLEDRLADESCDVSRANPLRPIDWAAVDARLNALRDYSLDFLRENLK